MRPLSLSARRRAAPLALLPVLAILAHPSTLVAQGRAGDRLLVLEKDAATARLLDPATGASVGTLPTGAFPHEVAVSPDGRWAVVADYGAQTPGSTLTVLDLPRRAVVRTIDLGEYRRPHGIVWLGGASPRVLVTSEESRNLLLVDVRAGKVVRAMPTAQDGSHMVVVSPNGRMAYTANIGSGTITAFDLQRQAAVKTVSIGRGPEAIDVSPDGRELWTADRTLNYVRILDARTLDSLGTMPTGAFPNRLKFTRDGRWVLVSNAAASAVSVYDAKSRALVTTISLPLDPARASAEHLASQYRTSSMPLGVLLTPDGRRAWVATAAMNELVEIEIGTWRVVQRVRTGTTPDGMGWVVGGR